MTLTPRFRLVVSLVMLSGCGGRGDGDNNGGTPTTPGGVTPAIIEITPSVQTIRGIGQTGTLTAVVKDARGLQINNPPSITWLSSASGIATVTSPGTSATARSLSTGTTIITATVTNGPSTQASVTVEAGVQSLSATPPSVALPVGGRQQVTAIPVADPGVNVSCTWTPANAAVATVSPSTGTSTTVTVVGAGSTSITLLCIPVNGSGGRSITIPVVGSGVVRAVSIDPKPAAVLVNGSQQLTANVDADAGVATTVTWSNAPNAFGSVSANGSVTGVSAGGPFKVYAASTANPAVRDSVDVTVVAPPSGRWIGRKTNSDPLQSGFRTTLVSIDFGTGVATDGGCAASGFIASMIARYIVLNFPGCGIETLEYTRAAQITGSGSFSVANAARSYATQWTLHPRTAGFSDTFSGTLSNWTIRDVDALASWTITNGELIGRNPTACFNCLGHATQLVLNQGLQPGTSSWRAEIQSNAIVAYNTGAQQTPVTGSNGQFTLWVSDTEKLQVAAGFAWVAGVPATEARATAGVERWQFPTNGIPWVALGSSGDVQVLPWSPTQWQTTTIEKIGNTYSVFFAGQKLYEFTPTLSATPRIGLYAKVGFVRLDNFALFTF